MQLRNKQPLITVIVPAYNEDKHIEGCLSSIKQQTYPRIELIVIDDGSKDRTREIAKKYTDKLLLQHHQGPGVARNKAAKLAKGSILVFVDADMYLDKNYVEKIVAPILSHKSQSSFTLNEYVANSINKWVRCYLIDNNLVGSEKNVRSDSQKSFFRAIRKLYFLKIGQYKTEYGYSDDYVNRGEFKIRSALAKGAISNHFNPETLLDIYMSSRWIGRSPDYNFSLRNIMRYSPLNSIVISFKKIAKGAPLQFIVYKLVFDFGILTGIFFKNPKNNYAK